MTDKSPAKPKIVEENESELIVVPGSLRPARQDEFGRQVTIPAELPVLPVRNLVLFPGMIAPLVIGRAKSQRLIEDVLPEQKVLLAVCQKDGTVDDPATEDLYRVGTAVMILKLLRIDDGNQGIIRVMLKYDQDGHPVIKELSRTSKPGRRIYSAVADLPRVLGGMGVAIVSTSKGVMSDSDCREANVGGEILCTVS